MNDVGVVLATMKLLIPLFGGLALWYAWVALVDAVLWRKRQRRQQNHPKTRNEP